LCMVAFYVVKWYKKKRREQRAAISSGIEDDEQRLELRSIQSSHEKPC